MSFITIHDQRAELLGQRYDDFFRYHDSELTEVTSDGDVESPYGYFTLREVTPEAITSASTYAGFGLTRIDPGWYVDVRDSDGTVWAFDYLGTGIIPEENARAAFEAHAEAYCDWACGVEE